MNRVKKASFIFALTIFSTTLTFGQIEDRGRDRNLDINRDRGYHERSRIGRMDKNNRINQEQEPSKQNFDEQGCITNKMNSGEYTGMHPETDAKWDCKKEKKEANQEAARDAREAARDTKEALKDAQEVLRDTRETTSDAKEALNDVKEAARDLRDK